MCLVVCRVRDDVPDEIAPMWKKMALKIIFDTVMKQSFFFLLLKHSLQQQAGNSLSVNQIEEMA